MILVCDCVMFIELKRRYFTFFHHFLLVLQFPGFEPSNFGLCLDIGPEESVAVGLTAPRHSA
jgi:hypothetical protein